MDSHGRGACFRTQKLVLGNILWQLGNVLWQLDNILWQLGDVLWHLAPILAIF